MRSRLLAECFLRTSAPPRLRVRPCRSLFALASTTGAGNVAGMKLLRVFFLLLFTGSGMLRAERADEPTVTPSTWNGFQRLDFTLAGRPCVLVLPKTPAAGNPWIWRAEFFGTEPQVDLALL